MSGKGIREHTNDTDFTDEKTEGFVQNNAYYHTILTVCSIYCILCGVCKRFACNISFYENTFYTNLKKKFKHIMYFKCSKAEICREDKK